MEAFGDSQYEMAIIPPKRAITEHNTRTPFLSLIIRQSSTDTEISVETDLIFRSCASHERGLIIEQPHNPSTYLHTIASTIYLPALLA